MKIAKYSRLIAVLAVGLAPLTWAASKARSQTVSQPEAADQKDVAAANNDDAYRLDPFVINADEDHGAYSANSTLAGTRVRTELKDIASSISVVTAQFLQDTAVHDNQGLLIYTPNTEVGGVSGNFSGLSGTTTWNEAQSLLTPNTNTRIRGLDAADNTRDYFLTNIPWDSFNVGRIDIQRGPNSILFGVGSPAGIINASVNEAGFANSNKIENQFDRYGSIRDSIDLNRVLIPDVLSIRFEALDNRTLYQQKPAFDNDLRYDGALRFDPKLFNDSAHTSIRLNFEHGTVSANRPNAIPPIDEITPWFLSGTDPKNVTSAFPGGVPYLNKVVQNPDAFGDIVNATVKGLSNPWYTKVGNESWAATGAYYGDPTNGTPSYYMETRTNNYFGISSAGVVNSTILGMPAAQPFGINGYHSYATSPLSGIAGGQYYSDKSLTDPSVFDFYNNLIGGPNSSQWQGWNALNASLEQSFFNDRLAFQAVYDSQMYQDGQIAGLGTPAISVDYNSVLDNQAPNPNFGRPYVAGSTEGGNNSRTIDRSGARFTATGELRPEDFIGRSNLASIIGKQVFTGLYSSDTTKTFSKQWAQSAAVASGAGDYGNTIQPGGDVLGNHIDAYDYVVYLGPSLANASTPSGANISRIKTIIQAPATADTTYFDSHWDATGAAGAKPLVDPSAPYTYTDPATGVTTTTTQSNNPANYVGWTSTPVQFINANNQANTDALTYLSSRQKDSITSKSIVWQGYLFDGDLVPTFGWRRDQVIDRSGAGTPDALGVVSTNYTYAPGETVASGDSRTWGVVGHLPESLASKLPLGLSLSAFYNQGQNFEAQPLRADVVGNALPDPTGKTKEYGVVVSALHGKVSLKVTRYETRVANATLQGDSAGFGGNLYEVWAMPVWGTTFAAQAQQYLAGNNPGNSWIGNYASVAGVKNSGPGDPNFDNASATATEKAALTAWSTIPLNQAFFNAWGFSPTTFNFAQVQAGNLSGYIPNWSPGTRLDLQQSGNISPFGTAPVATVDTLSRGYEFELIGQPTPNWNVSVNASNTFSSRDAINPTVIAFMKKMTAFFDGPGGNIELWGSSDTVGAEWRNNIASAFQVLQDQEGTSAPEISPWRLNAVTTYNFTNPTIKGVFVGGGYRWEEGRILGYHYNTTLAKLDVTEPYDGPADQHFDAWIGYSHPLYNKKVDWRIQLNLQNLGEKTRLVPISIEPDGSVGFSRIQEGLTWRLTNSLTF